jgi:hypothetical protein
MNYAVAWDIFLQGDAPDKILLTTRAPRKTSPTAIVHILSSNLPYHSNFADHCLISKVVSVV